MKNNQSGSTIIEALIALLILGFGLLATAKMQLNIGVGSQLARQRMEATNYASNALEELRAKVACNLVTVEKKPTQSSTTYWVTLTACTATAATVRVTWADSRGQQNNEDNKVELSTEL